MSDTVTGKIVQLNTPQDIDWRAEQYLAKILAERDLYWDGFTHGVIVAVMVVSFFLVAIWREFSMGKVK